VFEDKRFLRFRPLIGKGGEAFEFFLVDHMPKGWLSFLKQMVCKIASEPGDLQSAGLHR
jgi:hypothetical protein